MPINFSNNKNSHPILVIFIAVLISVLINFYLIKNNGSAASDKQIENYLENNTETVLNIFSNHYKKEADQKKADRDEKIKERKSEIYGKDVPQIGKDGAKLTIVEFFDYNCGYCKKAFNSIKKIAKEDLDLKIYFIDIPILGPSSVAKAKISIAGNMVDESKYFDLHEKLLNTGRTNSIDKLADVAAKLGYNKAQILEKANSKEVSEIISKNLQLANALGVNGTPALIINGKIVDGAIPYSEIKKRLQK